MNGVKKCPKCGNEMRRVSGLSDGHAAIELSNGLFSSIGQVIPFCSPKCGYIELYNEKNIGEE